MPALLAKQWQYNFIITIEIALIIRTNFLVNALLLGILHL